MSLKTVKTPLMRSAAWRVSLWATLAFAAGTMMVFAFLHHFVAHDIQQRSDAWLSGEVAVLGDVAEHTPKDRLYSRVVGEVAELATKEIPNGRRSTSGLNDSVFFIQAGEHGELKLWVGKGDGAAHLAAIRRTRLLPDTQADVKVDGFAIPFRVASDQMDDGSHIYLGLSERDEHHPAEPPSALFCALDDDRSPGLRHRVFGHAQDARPRSRYHGSRFADGQSDLNSRVPTSHRNDEVAHLALTLNGMLDRIQNSVNQLHTITDSLAHDLRSPLTAIRGKLEMYLSTERRPERTESIVSAIDELDRLSNFLNTSLDVAEAKADALRLVRTDIDLDELLRVMIDLYEPCMSDKGLTVRLRSAGPVVISGDAGMVHRMVANLFDNEWKHLPASSTVTFQLRARHDRVTLLLQDDGPGFADEVSQDLFEKRARGNHSTGHGLGLAFVHAVVHAHGGTVVATNRSEGGAQIVIELPSQASNQIVETSVLAAGRA